MNKIQNTSCNIKWLKLFVTKSKIRTIKQKKIKNSVVVIDERWSVAAAVADFKVSGETRVEERIDGGCISVFEHLGAVGRAAWRLNSERPPAQKSAQSSSFSLWVRPPRFGTSESYLHRLPRAYSNAFSDADVAELADAQRSGRCG